VNPVRVILAPLALAVVAERAAWEVRKLREAGRMRRLERRMENLIERSPRG
jgi:hypothetical protein